MSLGCVIYSKNIETGTLTAKWSSLKETGITAGTGIAKGQKGNQFEGEYQIQYYNNEGNPTSKFDLRIEEKDGQYLIYWIQDKEVKYLGIGFIENGNLVAGWRAKEN